MSGLFITIEGPDGAGKTSVLEELYPRLQLEAKRDIVKTREPGGVKSQKNSADHTGSQNSEMDERTEALLYAAARRQHLIQVILPALNEGKIVICDRFVDSSLAYQGAGRRIGIPEIARINEFATEGTEPDFTLYLDVDSDTGLRRIQEHRAHQLDRLDAEGLEFHQRVRHAYLKLAEENPVRIHKVDARMGLQDVVETSFSAIVEAYPSYFKTM